MRLSHTPDGFAYRDLNGNGRLDPYEDSRLPTADRVTDLLGRLSLAEKAGLMFHTVIEAGTDGSLLEKRYTEKISSRLSAFVPFNFVGEDIRAQKASE